MASTLSLGRGGGVYKNLGRIPDHASTSRYDKNFRPLFINPNGLVGGITSYSAKPLPPGTPPSPDDSYAHEGVFFWQPGQGVPTEAGGEEIKLGEGGWVLYLKCPQMSQAGVVSGEVYAGILMWQIIPGGLWSGNITQAIYSAIIQAGSE